MRPRRGTLRGEFTALWVAEALSTAGDQLARVAVAVLVYERTGSAVWSGFAYAMTLLPGLVAGPVLGPLADRLPRRGLMVVCCLQQAVLVAGMAVPGVPLGVLVVAVAAVAAIAAPFKAAQSGVVLDILESPQANKAGNARLGIVRETGQLAGLAGGAAVVATVGTTLALSLDAASFVAAAIILGLGLRQRPAARDSARPHADAGGALRIVAANPPVRLLCGLVLLCSVTAVPDGVIAPLVEQADGPPWAVTLMLAADCLGFIVGARFASRAGERLQRDLIAVLAVLSLVPLALFAVRPGLVPMAVLLVLSGIGAAYLPLIRGEIAERVPRDRVGAVTGLVGSALRAGQGLAVVGAGVLAQYLRSAAMAVAVTGAAGACLSWWCAVRWIRTLQAERAIG
ncbi:MULTISPECIES: MFS transporter [Actinomycetes]|uniref:MFS transporter n=1 Tax=Actinomycetes TaxID=1760 RepID=UPI00055FBBC0|nr:MULTISPECIES: MFS transporter [Actinomycetes]